MFIAGELYQAKKYLYGYTHDTHKTVIISEDTILMFLNETRTPGSGVAQYIFLSPRSRKIFFNNAYRDKSIKNLFLKV